MALDRSYFNNIRLGIVRGKFYKKEDVEALLDDIAAQAEAQTKELEELRAQLDAAEKGIAYGRKDIDHTIGLAQVIISEANDEAKQIIDTSSEAAETILSKAVEARTAILNDAEDKKTKRVEMMKKLQSDTLSKLEESFEDINSIWRDFLDAFDDNLVAPEQTGEAPEDLGAKVEALARELEAITIEDQ